MGFLNIHEQSHPDECTACAISAIAEDVLQEAVDPQFLYSNSKGSEFGITALQAIGSALTDGVRLLSGSVVFPFSGYEKVGRKWWAPWNDLFSALEKGLEDGPLFCGCYWQTGWADVPSGMIPEDSKNDPVAPHAFKVCRAETIDGKEFLLIQNSRGPEKGDGGFWHMPRSVANRMLFAYKLITKKDE